MVLHIVVLFFSVPHRWMYKENIGDWRREILQLWMYSRFSREVQTDLRIQIQAAFTTLTISTYKWVMRLWNLLFDFDKLFNMPVVFNRDRGWYESKEEEGNYSCPALHIKTAWHSPGFHVTKKTPGLDWFICHRVTTTEPDYDYRRLRCDAGFPTHTPQSAGGDCIYCM